MNPYIDNKQIVQTNNYQEQLIPKNHNKIN